MTLSRSWRILGQNVMHPVKEGCPRVRYACLRGRMKRACTAWHITSSIRLLFCYPPQEEGSARESLDSLIGECGLRVNTLENDLESVLSRKQVGRTERD